MRILCGAVAAMAAFSSHAQEMQQTAADHAHRFAEVDYLWPSPNDFRLATGAPGPRYFQQEASYHIEADLDEGGRTLKGSAVIDYRNNAPYPLDKLWFELSRNRFKSDSVNMRTTAAPPGDAIPQGLLRRTVAAQENEPGYSELNVEINGAPVAVRIVNDRFRVDLYEPLKSNSSIRITISWTLALADLSVFDSRSGYYCGEHDRCVFLLHGWFPRIIAYTDYDGWSLGPFIGRGEYSVDFADYDVTLRAPEDVVVAGSGTLTDPKGVLGRTAANRLRRLGENREYIIPLDRARSASSAISHTMKEWRFTASSVRDFALAASARYAWQAFRPSAQGPTVSAFFTPEAASLWENDAIEGIALLNEIAAEYFGDYPFSAAQIAYGPVGAMENTMLAFAGNVPEGNIPTEDERYDFLSTVFHEAAHNYFPSTINSDERAWGWMDEGLATFFEYEAEQAWSSDFPSTRGNAETAINYLQSKWRTPIMAPPDTAFMYFGSAYAHAAAALCVLRDLVLGPDVFMDVMKTYNKRWQFKRATPYDFFRTVEDVSGQELDWFWRAWYYSTELVDLSLSDVRKLDVDGEEFAGYFVYLLTIRNSGGAPSPVPLRFYYTNESYEDVILPAHLWRRGGNEEMSTIYLYAAPKLIKAVELDPENLTGDAHPENNGGRLQPRTVEGQVR